MSTDTRSYSLPSEVIEFIDALPKRERSKFVSAHLSRAVQYQKKMKLVASLRSFDRVKNESGESAVETLRKARKEASNRLLRKT